jgi:hypothetical protein
VQSRTIFKRAMIALGIATLTVLATTKLLGLWYDVNWTQLSANRILQTEILRNDVIAGELSKLIPTDPALATREHGDGFLGTSFVPKLAYSILHLDIRVVVSADGLNDAVVAVFVNWQERPLRIVSQPVSANTRAKIEFNLDVPTRGTYPNGFLFRIGPARPGVLTLNGPAGADRRVESAVRITEIGG